MAQHPHGIPPKKKPGAAGPRRCPLAVASGASWPSSAERPAAATWAARWANSPGAEARGGKPTKNASLKNGENMGKLEECGQMPDL
jgi:hypothetical protein